MLTIDRANVQLEPVPSGQAPAAAPPPPTAATPSAPTSAAPSEDAAFRDRVVRVLEDVLREMDRRGSR